MKRLVFAGALLSACLVIGLAADSAAPSPCLSVAPPGSGGGKSLSLAPDLSFVDDSSSSFPIRGENLGDAQIASDRPTVVFFGTSHCWNTNREAERFVNLYRTHSGEARFLVVDLNHSSPDQKCLVTSLFHGSIPTIAFLDRTGRVVYDEAGETARERGETSRLLEILKTAASPAH